MRRASGFQQVIHTWNLEPDSHPFINAWKAKHPIFKAIVAAFQVVGFSGMMNQDMVV